MRTAATLARKSSTHHMLDTVRQLAQLVASAKWSFDPEVDRNVNQSRQLAASLLSRSSEDYIITTFEFDLR